MKRLSVALLAAATLGAAPGFAAQPASTQVDRRLHERRVAQSAQQKGETRHELEMEQQRLDRMIHDLESGREVGFERTIKRGDGLR